MSARTQKRLDIGTAFAQKRLKINENNCVYLPVKM